MDELATSAVKFYRHSGKAPLRGLILLGLTGPVAAPVLGIVYGYLTFYIPLIYLNMAIVVGYVYAISWLLIKVARYGKIRNIPILAAAALGIGVLADYAGWVSWIAALFGSPAYLVGFFYPGDVLAIIAEIAKQGAWTFDGITPKGDLLYLIWLAEAGVVIGGITYMTVKSLASVPFCEECEAWAQKRSTLGVFRALDDPHQLKADLLQRGVSAFDVLEKNDPEENDYTLLDLFECEQCRNFFVLHVDDVALSFDRKGKMTSKVTPIVSNLLLSPSTLARLRRLAAEQNQQVPA